MSMIFDYAKPESKPYSWWITAGIVVGLVMAFIATLLAGAWMLPHVQRFLYHL